MKLKINGKEEIIESQSSLAELVESKKLKRNNIVIEHNLTIIPKEDWESVLIRDNDNIEIVSFVGGG